MFVGKNHFKAYEDLKRKIEAKLQGWKLHLLSQARKLTLIKFVVNVIPLYAMSTSRLPLMRCKDIERMTSKFLWDNKGNSRHFVPIAWSRLRVTADILFRQLGPGYVG